MGGAVVAVVAVALLIWVLFAIVHREDTRNKNNLTPPTAPLTTTTPPSTTPSSTQPTSKSTVPSPTGSTS